MADGMKIAIVGAGGVGGLMAALLLDAGEDVALIARGDSLRAIRDHGLFLESGMGNLRVRPRLVTDRPAEAGLMDLVVVATKAWQLEEAAQAIKPTLGPETAVLPVQNGLEASDILSAVLGREHVLVGVVSVTSYQDGPGRIVCPGDGIGVQVGEQDSRRTPRVERIAAMLKAARMECEVAADVQRALWGKLVGLSAWSAVGALTRAPLGVWRESAGAVDLYRGLMEESIAVAAAQGVTLPERYVFGGVEGLPGRHADATCSMQRDVMEGRPSELEYQVGVIVRKGAEVGVATPLHALAYGLLLPQETLARGTR